MARRRGYNPWLGVLGVGLALAALWGYGQMLQKDRVMQRVEGQYQRAFHQLIDHTVNIEANLGRLLVSSNRQQQIIDLDMARQHAVVAREVMAQLPVNTVELGKTTAFFGGLADTTDALAMKLLDNETLTEADRAQLKELHQASVYARDELFQVAQAANAGRMRWIDAEKLTATDYQGGSKNPLVDNLMRFDGGLNVATKPSSIKPYKAVTGAEVSAQEAVNIGARFVGDLLQPGTLRSTQEVPGDVKTYQLEGTAKGGQRLTMQITAKGGLPMWMLTERIPGNRTLDRGQAIARAEEFLRSRMPMIEPAQGLTFVPITYDESESIARVALVPKQGDVILYPDVINLKVALDNGEVLGFNARDYLRNHTSRPNLKPKLTEAEARSKVSPSLQVQNARLAIVLNDRDEEALVYEVRGLMGSSPYQVFISAEDGKEELIQRAANKL